MPFSSSSSSSLPPTSSSWKLFHGALIVFFVACLGASLIFPFSKIKIDEWRDQRLWKGPLVCHLDACASFGPFPCSLSPSPPTKETFLYRGYLLPKEEEKEKEERGEKVGQECFLVQRTFSSNFTVVQFVSKQEGDKICLLESNYYNNFWCFFSLASSSFVLVLPYSVQPEWINYEAQENVEETRKIIALVFLIVAGLSVCYIGFTLVKEKYNSTQ